MVGLSAALLDQLVDQRAVRIRKIFADDGLGFADRLPVRAQMELVVLRLQNDRVAGSKLELVAQLIPNLRCFDSHWIVVNSAVCCFLSLQGDAARGRSMAEALAIRDDIPVEELRRVARRETNGRVASRLLALANALDGMARGQAARQAGMDRQTLRDWVIRFNAEGVDGLHDRPKSGRPIWLDDGELATLKATWSGPRARRRQHLADPGIVPDRRAALRRPLQRKWHVALASRPRLVVFGLRARGPESISLHNLARISTRPALSILARTVDMANFQIAPFLARSASCTSGG
jgi:hypothetical protein